MPGGLDPSKDTPWYVNVVVYAVNNIAPWVLVSAVAVSLVTGWLPFPVLTAFLTLKEKVELAIVEIRRDIEVTQQAVELMRENVKVQRIICWNTARDEAERKRCLPGRDF